MTKSLREQILGAVDVQALDALLELGASPQYAEASPRTRSRWRSAARKRRQQLKAEGK